MEKRGIDVSSHQGDIDWKKVKDKIDFAMIRVSFGQRSVDNKAQRNIENCMKYNIPFGVYVYSYAMNLYEAEQEANNCLAQIAKYSKYVKYPVVIDMEDADGYKTKHGMPSKQMLTDICKKECDIFRANGYYPAIYANLDWFRNKLDTTQLVEYDKWLAQWASKPTWGQPFGMWQYSSCGSVDGIKGNVDMNIAYKDYPYVISNGVIEAVELKSDEEIAREVINGQWGNGEQRKLLLEQAGYNYENVQRVVNEKLSNKKDVMVIVQEVIDGKWGNGTDRKNRLNDAGYNYDTVQSIINAKLQTRTYTVQFGDYLTKIGQKLGVDWKEIAKMNGIKSPYVIYVGQILKY